MRERDELASAFFELEAVVRQSSRMPGLAAAQEEARRRRGHRIAWVAAGTVVLLLAGVASVVPGWLRRGGPPVLEPTPTTSVTTTPTPVPTVTTGPVAATVLGDMTPPDRIRDVTIDVPAFDLPGCPSGRLEFRNRSFGSSVGTILMESTAVGDVDADGREDIVIALRCAPGGSGHVPAAVQVLAYSGPALALLGSVPTGGLTKVTSLLVRPDGDVELGMAQADDAQGITFGRYRWNGSGFARIDGIEVPGDALPAVVVSAEPSTIRLAPGGAGATVVVAIRSDGRASALPLQLTIVWPESAAVDVDDVATSTAESRHDLLIVAPEVGQTVTVTLRIALPAGATLPGGAAILFSVESGRRTDATNSHTLMIPLQPA